VQPLDEGLVVVVGDVGIDEEGVGRQVTLPDCADETFALELFRLQESARQEDEQGVRARFVTGRFQVRFHGCFIKRV
jgi:hypothetical protein